MKNLFKYALILTVAAGFVACAEKEVEDTYTPAGEDLANCYGVSFPKQDATGSHTFDPEAVKSMTFTAKRTNTTGDITVPVEIVDTAGVFKVDDIVFADGQDETTFDVTFDDAKLGVNYGLTLSVTDPAYASVYGAGVPTFSFDVLVVTWVDFLNPLTNEPAVFTINSRWDSKFGPMHATLKYYEVGGVRTGYFTSIDTDDEGNAKGFWHSDPSVNLAIRWYIEDQDGLSHVNNEGNDFVELPKQYFGYDYNNGEWLGVPLEEAATPIYVYDYPWYWVERGYNWGSSGMGANWLDEANKTGGTDGSYPAGYYDGNGAFFFNIYFYIPGLGGWSPDGYGTIAIAEGFDRRDYTIKAVKTDYSAGGETPVYVETGKEVQYIKYAVYPGELTSTQALNKAPLIADGTDASEKFEELILDEAEGVKYVTLGLAPETSGLYTFVAVTFDENDEAQDAGYVVINHVAADDVEANEVHVSVFTEDTPARYQELHKYDSFAIGVAGEELTEVHVGIFDEATVAQYGGDAVMNAVKSSAQSYGLTEEETEKVNADGGYYDVVSGLKAKTVYYVIVWATNGAMENFAIASYETDKLPYVWEELGQGTLTDGFFVSLFSRSDYTVPCTLYKEKNTPGLYMMTDYQLPLVAAFFSMTEEDMLQYEGGNWNRTELVIDATDPNAVVISEQDYGVCVNSSYGFVLIDTESTGVLADGVITFPAKNMYVGLGGSWYYGNTNGTFEIRFPEAVTSSTTAVRSNNGKVEEKTLSNAFKADRKKVVYERDAQPVKVAVKVSYTRKAAEKVFPKVAKPEVRK